MVEVPIDKLPVESIVVGYEHHPTPQFDFSHSPNSAMKDFGSSNSRHWSRVNPLTASALGVVSYDFLTPIPPRFVTFAWRYLGVTRRIPIKGFKVLTCISFPFPKLSLA